MKLVNCGKMEVRSSPVEGLGVFATAPIKAGEILEEIPFVLFPRANNLAVNLFKMLKDTGWMNPKEEHFENLRMNMGFKEPEKYYFKWFPPVQMEAGHMYTVLPLGFGPIYNSSNTANNAEWKMLERTFMFRAEKDIDTDEEIRTFYGYFLGDDGQTFNCDTVWNLAIDMFNGEHRLKLLRFGDIASFNQATRNPSFAKTQQLITSSTDGLKIAKISTHAPDMKELSSVNIPENINLGDLYRRISAIKSNTHPIMRFVFSFTSKESGALMTDAVDFRK